MLKILAGERVTDDGLFYQAKGFQQSVPPKNSVVIYCGAVHPMILQLSGDLVDGVLLARVSARKVPRSLVEIAKAAERVGRALENIEIGRFPLTYVSRVAIRRPLVVCAASWRFIVKVILASKAFGPFAIGTWLMKSCTPGRLGFGLALKQRFQRGWLKTFLSLAHHKSTGNVLNALSKLVFKGQGSRGHDRAT